MGDGYSNYEYEEEKKRASQAEDTIEKLKAKVKLHKKMREQQNVYIRRLEAVVKAAKDALKDLKCYNSYCEDGHEIGCRDLADALASLDE